jgi:acetolactate synthase-1/2/3 large subunit
MLEKKLTVADYIAGFISQKKSSGVFQLSGGMIAFLTDSIHNETDTPLIHNRHEQASGFAAEGATRVSGVPSFAMGTSGPGATNLITPIASSFFDSTPVMFITGQVHTDEIRKSTLQRQNGFQELDICQLVSPITKMACRIIDPNDIPQVLEDAWTLAQSGRPGPVLIDIPIDVQQKLISKPIPELISENKSQIENSIKGVTNQDVSLIKNLLENAEFPLVLVGGGVRIGGAVKQLREFLKDTHIPHVATLLGIDSVDHQSPDYLGFIGSYGNRWANEALSKADVILVLGSRLDVRQTGANVSKFTRGKTIIRVDIDNHELSGRIASSVAIQDHISNFLGKLMESSIRIRKSDFVIQTRILQKEHPQTLEQSTDLRLNPSEVMEEISKVFRKSNGYVVDVGQHQMWAAQSLSLRYSQRFITSGGLGAMGFALPAAIGAAIAELDRWVVIIGDGCIQLSIQELQTISQYNLPIVVCVINNEQHGMVAQFQEENMDSRFIGTRQGYSNPRFKVLAEGFGIKNYLLVENNQQLKSLEEGTSDFLEGPALIEFKIDYAAKALPKMKFESD